MITGREGAMIIGSSCDGNISSSYSRIKFITLSKYLTLYQVSNFEPYLCHLTRYFIDSPLSRR